MSQAKLRRAVRNQVEMRMLSLDQMLSEDHLAREIWDYVQGMALGELEDQVVSARGEAGAPAFDPRTLLCLWLYATVDSVGSARRLARLVVDSLPYRWIAGGDAINYHTLSDFRTRHGAMLDRLLTASVALLAHEGRIDLEAMTVAHDGMRVRASAGFGSMRRRPSLEQALADATQHLERMKRQEDEPGPGPRPDGDGPAPPTARQRAARQRAARERVERLAQALSTMEELETKKRLRNDPKASEPRVSTTDPKAAALKMANGGKNVAHNIQFTTEVTTRAITAVMVADMSSDTGMLEPAMENHRRAHARLPDCVLADKGFFKYEDIDALEQKRCAVLMPDPFPDAEHPKRLRKRGPNVQVWRERMLTQEAEEKYKLRSSTVEWSNARVRQQGLQQLTVRGPAKVLAIGLWHALTHNILRTLALRRQTPALAA